MSLGAPPNANGDEVSPIVGESGPPPPADPNAKIVQDVVNSEVRNWLLAHSKVWKLTCGRLEFRHCSID